MAIIEKKYRIDLEHVGKSNLLTNHGILCLLESVACYHSDLVGYGINNIDKTGVTWVLLHWKVEVIKRVPYGASVTVKTWAGSHNRISTYRDFEIYDEEENLICKASSKWALIDLSTKSIGKITEELISVYEPDEKTAFANQEIAKLKIPEPSASSNFTFQVLRKDIDVNEHMHNLYYLDYAYEALPQDVYELGEPNRFEIMYKTGATLGNMVNCYYVHENASHVVVMRSSDKTQLHAIINLG